MGERKIFLQPTADGRVRATTDVPTKNFPEVGKVDGGKLHLWRASGTLSGSELRWSNGPSWRRVGAVAATLDAEIAAERASKNPPTKGTLHTPKTPPVAPASSARRLIVGLGVVAGAVLCLCRRRPRTVVGHYRPVSKENLAELAENIRA